MTGFGKHTATIDYKNIAIELRTLNSKQADISLRMPSLFREKELEIRNLISQQLERGKIDLSIQFEKNSQPTVSINSDLAQQYYTQLKALSDTVENNGPSDIFRMAVFMPEVISSNNEELTESFWSAFFEALASTLEKVNVFRATEGEVLKNDLINRVHLIIQHLEKITPFEEERLENMRKKIGDALEKLQQKEQIDKNRFEQELIYYIEKIDITEEKVRLKQHATFFLETIENTTSSGKKLGFIAQELGREINTIGSKANNFHIQQIVVAMKDELEKIKEQLLNIL